MTQSSWSWLFEKAARIGSIRHHEQYTGVLVLLDISNELVVVDAVSAGAKTFQNNRSGPWSFTFDLIDAQTDKATSLPSTVVQLSPLATFLR